MSLAANISSLATRIGTEFKSVYAKIGTLSSLTTTNKTDLVSAINEVKASTGSSGAAINDTTPSGTTTYSSNKINSLDSATLTSANSYADGKAAIAGDLGGTAASPQVTGGTHHTHTASQVSDSTTVGRSVLTAVDAPTARAAIGAGTSSLAINDTTASTSTVYSATKTDGQISAAVSNLVASAPATLDTLNELATALGNDANFATTTSTALGNRLRFDAAQTLTAGQQTQGQANLAVPSTTQVGDTTTDFVATFNAALV